MSKEKEIQEALLENWLIQIAVLIGSITRRLCNPESPDDVAKECQKKLEDKLTEEEIKILCKMFPVQSVMDFTEYAAQKRGLFAASVKGDPLFRQAYVARVMAEGVGDETFVENICVPEGDQTDQLAAQRQQQMEMGAFQVAAKLSTGIPVLPFDNDWIHMQTLKPGLLALLQSKQLQVLQVALNHYAAHYAAGVNKKTIPKEQINAEKSFIAAVEDQMNAIQQQQQIQAKAQQAQAEAQQAASTIVGAEQINAAA